MNFFNKRQNKGFRRHNGHRGGKMIYIDKVNCTCCGICVKICKQNVFEKIDDSKGIHIEVKNPENCTHCRECFSACKFNALTLIRKTA